MLGAGSQSSAELTLRYLVYGITFAFRFTLMLLKLVFDGLHVVPRSVSRTRLVEDRLMMWFLSTVTWCLIDFLLYTLLNLVYQVVSPVMSWCVFGVYALLTRLLFRPPCSMTEGSFAEEDLVVNQPPGHSPGPHSLAGRPLTASLMKKSGLRSSGLLP